MMNCKVKEQKLFSMIKLYAYIFMYVDMNIMYVNCKLNTIFDFFRELHKTPTEDLNTGKNQRRHDTLVSRAKFNLLLNRKSASIYRYLMRVTLSNFQCFTKPITAFMDD